MDIRRTGVYIAAVRHFVTSDEQKFLGVKTMQTPTGGGLMRAKTLTLDKQGT